MSSPRTEFDLLLQAPTSVEAEMAREILSQEGIPTYLHGRDRDLAELGVAIHNSLTRPDLYVPKGRGAEAEAILKAAWDESALSDELALSVPTDDEVLRPPRSIPRLWSILFGVAALVAILCIYYRDFILSRRAGAP